MHARWNSARLLWRALVAAGLGLLAGSSTRTEAAPAFVPKVVNSSTIPANGDVNPYGVAFVPAGFPSGGLIAPGDVLVANFNDSGNLQGTGTTIVSFSPNGALAPPGTATVFFSSPLAGLDTALGVLRGGFVIVGNVPTTDGTYATIGQGALQVIDRHGDLVGTLSDSTFLDSPWDLAIDDEGDHARIFVSNVLSGTVTRVDVAVGSTNVMVLRETIIGQNYAHAPNGAALVVGPTGLAFDRKTGALYVASTADNAIFAVTNAAHATGAVNKGIPVFSDPSLRGPLALRFAPNGNLLTANGDAFNADPLHPSEIVEFTTNGRFVREYDVDSSQGGAFGIDTVLGEDAPFNYAVIDDVTNNLSVSRQPGE